MRSALWFFVCLVAYSEGLECGIAKVKSDEVKKTLTMCIKNNETLERIWEMASSSAASSSDSTEDSSMEDEQPQKPSARMSRVAKRESNISAATEEPADKSTVATEDSTTSSSADVGDACIVQCVFKQLGMTDNNGLPDLSKIVEGLVKNATGRELRIFLQEATGECFQQMGQENISDPCAYSSKLVTCLANKGRMNCEDWPAGSLPF